MGFLKSELAPASRDRLLTFRDDINDFAAHGREEFWLRRVRNIESLVTGAKMEKALAMPATFRNVTTVRTLALKASAPAE